MSAVRFTDRGETPQIIVPICVSGYTTEKTRDRIKTMKYGG
uniref:Uncharacterized protein n=1 Tax=viral metagenome TaxID=1070528 RepID=A0A6M3JLD3_9ZZZZ